MTRSFCEMVYLFSCAIHGKSAVLDPASAPDYEEIKKAAIRQGVWPFVFSAIKEANEAGSLSVDAELLQHWNVEVLYNVMNKTQAEAQAAQAILHLQREGIPCCVLKGASLAVLYPNPTCRFSGDTDILIPEEMESAACAILEKEGFSLMTRHATSHHVVAKHPNGATLEVHISLYDDIYEENWFGNSEMLTEPFREFETEYGRFSSLGVTDGAIFVLFHFIKHFLSSGAGIRQLADVLLYFAAFGRQIDWERLGKSLVPAKCDRLFAQMLGAGVRYLGFEEGSFPPASYDEEVVDHLVEDLAARGGFNESPDHDGDIYIAYFKKLMGEQDKDAEEYLAKKRKENFRSMMFPKAENMQTNYPYVKKSRFLVPVAWVHRMLRYAWRRFVLRQEEKEAYISRDNHSALYAERIRLASELEMLERKQEDR